MMERGAMKVYLTSKDSPKKNPTAPSRSAAQLMIGKLNDELQRRIVRMHELERALFTEGEYPDTEDSRSLWSEYYLTEQEVNRLKGAMGALRWASGKAAGLDVDLPGYVIIPESRLKSYERREEQKQATFGGVEVDEEYRYSHWDT